MALAEIPSDRLMLETDSPDGLPRLTEEWMEALPGMAKQMGDRGLLAGVLSGGQVSFLDA